MANDATTSPGATPSPADTLRRAAAEIRADWCGVAESWGAGAFYLAVADWLDRTAENADRASLYARGVDCQQALVVARAYLGEAS